MLKCVAAFLLLVLVVAATAGATPPFIPILLPVYNAPTPGAFGSLWIAELMLHNGDAATLVVCTDECKELTLPAGSHTEFLTAYAAAAGQPPGLILGTYAPADVAISLRVRDVSRNAQSFGVELPAVRPQMAVPLRKLDLLNVPLQPEYRHKVRLYDMTGGGGSLRLRAFDADANEEFVTMDVELRPVPGRKTLAYAEADPFPAEVVAARAGHHIRVEIARTDGQLVNWNWAFFTVTNNVTQEVTIVTPQ